MKRSTAQPAGIHLLLVALTALTAMACAPGVKVIRCVAAPRLDLGATDTIYLAPVGGTEDAIPLLERELVKELSDKLRYKVVRGKTDGAAELSARVVRSSSSSSEVVQATSGTVVNVQRTEFLEAEFRLVGADGTVLTRSYVATQRGFPQASSGSDRSAALAMARGNARTIASRLIEELLPESNSVRLSFANDEASRPGLALAERGELSGAEDAWRAAGSHGARYNLGLLLESRGEPALAEVEYQAAVSLAPDPMYQRALDEVRHSIALSARARR